MTSDMHTIVAEASVDAARHAYMSRLTYVYSAHESRVPRALCRSHAAWLTVGARVHLRVPARLITEAVWPCLSADG
jgi:hypothetical protein